MSQFSLGEVIHHAQKIEQESHAFYTADAEGRYRFEGLRAESGLGITASHEEGVPGRGQPAARAASSMPSNRVWSYCTRMSTLSGAPQRFSEPGAPR